MELWLVVLAVGATGALAVVTYVKRPDSRRIAKRGVRNAVIAAIVVGSIILVLAMFLFSAQSIFGTMGLGQLLSIALIAGGGWFVLNLAILEIGLWFRPSPIWAVGSAFATPVILAALGFGYISFNAYQEQAAEHPVYEGTISLAISGARIGSSTASGKAQCNMAVNGARTIDASLIGSDGKKDGVQLAVKNGEVIVLGLGVGDDLARPGNGWDVGPATVQTDAGPNGLSGKATFQGVVPIGVNNEPDPSERWSGTVAWICS